MISRTLSQVFSQTILPSLAGIGLLLFLAVFIGALVWVNRRGSSSFYQTLSRMPLDEENEVRS